MLRQSGLSLLFSPPAEAEAEPGASGAPSRSPGARGRTSGVQEAAPTAHPRAAEARCGGGSSSSARSRGAGTARLAAVVAANRAPSLPGCSACEELGQRRGEEEVGLWHILFLTSTGKRRTNSLSSSQAVRPSLAFGKQPPSTPVMCASLTSNGASFLLPAALFARSSAARRPFSTNTTTTTLPRYESPRFPAGARAFAHARRGLSRPLIFGDKSLVRGGGGGKLALLFPSRQSLLLSQS